MTKNPGVHITHCCVTHGCKYGSDEECPVFRKEEFQKYPCELCESYNTVDRRYKKFDSVELEKAEKWYKTHWNKLNKHERIIMYWENNPDYID